MKLKASPVKAVVAKVEKPVAAPPVSATGVEEIVRQAARKYGLDENHLVSIAMCESTMNPSAVNYDYWEDQNGVAMGGVGQKYHPSGLIQHITKYYPARAQKYGYSTDVFDAYSNANTTAAMFADGLSYLWECS